MTPEEQRRMRNGVAAYYSSPFRPAEAALSEQARIANAAEYIAAAMGRISERLESIDQKLARRNFPTTEEPPFYPRQD